MGSSTRRNLPVGTTMSPWSSGVAYPISRATLLPTSLMSAVVSTCSGGGASPQSGSPVPHARWLGKAAMASTTAARPVPTGTAMAYRFRKRKSPRRTAAEIRACLPLQSWREALIYFPTIASMSFQGISGYLNAENTPGSL